MSLDIPSGIAPGMSSATPGPSGIAPGMSSASPGPSGIAPESSQVPPLSEEWTDTLEKGM